MPNFMASFSAQTYALLRMVAGFLLLWHGSQKLLGFQALLPLENRGELAALYCFVFLFISAEGPGIWSLDGVRKGSK